MRDSCFLLLIALNAAVLSSSFVILPEHHHARARYRALRSLLMGNDDEPDLFEYFDPLLSPHAYPNGVSPENKPIEGKLPEPKDAYNPLRFPSLDEQQSATTTEESPIMVDTAEVFDPTLSPHAYPNGTPSTIIGDNVVVDEQQQYRMGILLMDHGSRNQASNDRLHELADIYQKKVGSKYVVRAAHMELASPSIPEALEKLVSEGVDEIVCHPYFLSANGRHVSEDIPEILEGAIQSLNIEIPVVTTEPVGANTQVMIGAIQSIVQQAATFGGKQRSR